jgi:hypothetical protein
MGPHYGDRQDGDAVNVQDIRRKYDLGHVLTREEIGFILGRAEKAGDWAEDTVEIPIVVTDAWEVD